MVRSYFIFVVALFLSSALFFGVACKREIGLSGQLEKVSMRMPIPVISTGQHPFFYAKDKGFYEEVGIDVSFDQGSRDLNPIKMVEAGHNDFGMLGGPDGIIVARSQGVPIRAIATIHRNSNFPCVITLKDSGITKAEQLDGKKVGFFYGHISTDVIRNLFRKAKAEVEEVNVGFDYSQLISGRIDAQWAFTVRAVLQLPDEGIELNVIYPADYGINTHGYTIFATEDVINNKPELVENFLKATFKGIQQSLAKPEEALQSIYSRNGSLDEKFARESQAGFDAVTSRPPEFSYGYIDETMFKETYERLLDEGIIETPFDFTQAYTTRFLDKRPN